MLPVGTPLPAFRLPDADGRVFSSDEIRGTQPLLVMFTCNHCPYARHIRQGFGRFAADYQPRGLAIVAIMSNDVAMHPEDGPEGMKEEARQGHYAFPYLHDESQEVAKAFRAACTPDLFLFDASGTLVYRGQFDGSRPGNAEPVTGSDLRGAVDAVLNGTPVTDVQKASIGCNIKWKPGNEPDYAR